MGKIKELDAEIEQICAGCRASHEHTENGCKTCRFKVSVGNKEYEVYQGVEITPVQIMAEKKKHCWVTLTRTETFDLEGDLTKEEWQKLKEHLDGNTGTDGGWIMEFFEGYDEDSASSDEDNVEEYGSDWDEE